MFIQISPIQYMLVIYFCSTWITCVFRSVKHGLFLSVHKFYCFFLDPMFYFVHSTLLNIVYPVYLCFIGFYCHRFFFFLLFKMSMNPKTIVIFHQQSLQHVLNIVKQSSLCIYRCVKHILFIMLNIVFCREAATVSVLTTLTVWERFAP